MVGVGLDGVDGVGSSLKVVKILLQHFWMLQDVALVWPAPSQHLTTRFNNVARGCVEMLHAFDRALKLPYRLDPCHFFSQSDTNRVIH